MVGLGVMDKPGTYGKTVPVISTIKEGSLVAGTPLSVGMHLYSINGVPTKGRDDATAMMKVSEGSIDIVAGPPGLVFATVTKATKDAKVGLHIERYKSSQKVFVGSVKGLFAQTDLKEGMTILKINGADVTSLPMAEVLSKISDVEGKVTILAQAPFDFSKKLMGHPPPEGLAGGEWGTTSYVGSQTAGLAIAAIPTVIGWAIILLIAPSDYTDVYKVGGNLYTPNGKYSMPGVVDFWSASAGFPWASWLGSSRRANFHFVACKKLATISTLDSFFTGEFFKNATSHNFEVRKSEHITEKVNGVWGTTTYVGPLTWSLAIISIFTVIGPILILLFFPLDERDIYFDKGNLYTASVCSWFDKCF